MRKSLLLLLFLALNYMVFGQNRILTDEEINKSSLTKMAILGHCETVNDLFKADLENQTLFLLLQGGIAPVVFSTDRAFENKYQVYYYDFGCIAPKLECVTKYNQLVFNYLTRLYGNKWRNDVRKDVLGLRKRKQK